MGMGYFGSVGFMLAQVLLGLLLLLPVLRVILPLSRVRFGNPVCQAVYRAVYRAFVPARTLTCASMPCSRWRACPIRRACRACSA